MTMIERLAQGIYEEDDPWAAAFPWPNVQGGKSRADNYRRIARATIELLREPTPGMLVGAGTMEGYRECNSCSLGGPDDDHIAWWNAMIDAALEEGSGNDHD